MRIRFVRPLGVGLLVATMVGACVQVWQTVPSSIPVSTARTLEGSRQISTPVKAHLLDGSTVVFADGAVINMGRLTGRGRLYRPLEDSLSVPYENVPLDSIVGLETFERKRLVAQ